MRRGVPGRKYLDVLQTGGVRHDNLLAPIAHKVAVPRRVRLRAVDKSLGVAVHRERATILRTLDDVVLDKLTRQRAVEPHGHAAAALLSLGVDGGLRAVLPDVVALIVEELTARIFREEITHQTASHVIIAIGNAPNPLIRSTTKGLEANKKGCIIVNEETMATTKDGVYAGGDAVTGASTVIKAMGAGRMAAHSIDEYIKNKN